MKITPKQYAITLYSVIKKDDNIKDAVRKFIKVLVDNNDISKSDKIVEEFIKIWDRENGIINAKVASARKLDNESVKSINDYILESSKAKEVVLDKKIDKNILGGVIIKFGDKVIDGSLKMKLKELKNNLVK